MKFLAFATILAILPLAGIAYVVVTQTLFTVDGLFMILMFGGISATFGIVAFMEAYGMGLVPFLPKPEAKPATNAKGTPAVAPQDLYGIFVASGTVRDLRFFEASVGDTNKTLVEFVEDGSSTPRFVTFIGNVRDQLPIGTRVRITYRAEPEGNTLLARDQLLRWGREAKPAEGAHAKAPA